MRCPNPGRTRRPLQLKYSQLMYGLAAENIMINRKALSELAINEPKSFKARRGARLGSRDMCFVSR